MSEVSVSDDNVIYQRGEDAGSDTWDDTILIKAYDDAVSALKAKFAEEHPEVNLSQKVTVGKKKKKARRKSRKKNKIDMRFVNDWNVGDVCKAAFTEDGEIYAAQILAIDDDSRTCTVLYTGYGNEEEQALEDLLPPSSNASSTDNKTDTASETEHVNRKAREKLQHTMNKSRDNHSNADGHQRSRLNPPRWPWNNFPSQGASAASHHGHQHPSQHGPPPPPPPHQHTTAPPSFPYPLPPFGPQSSCAGHPAFGMPSMFPHMPPPPPLLNASNCEDDNEALYTMLMSWYMSGYHTGYYQGLKNSTKAASGASPYIPHR